MEEINISETNQELYHNKRRVFFTGLKFLISQTFPFFLSLLLYIIIAYIIPDALKTNYLWMRYFLWFLMFIPALILAVYINIQWTKKLDISRWWTILFLLLQIPIYIGLFWLTFGIFCSINNCSF